jgi:hypothetical protein
MKHEAYFESPYKYMNIDERFYTTKENEELTTNMETGEMFVMRRIAKDKKLLHDSLVYTKLFQDSIRQLCALSGPAIKILMYAMATVKPMSETVILNGPDVMLFCNIGKSSFYDGTIELLDKRIICKKLGSNIEFWFDPNVFFNGNRVKACSSKLS